MPKPQRLAPRGAPHAAALRAWWHGVAVRLPARAALAWLLLALVVVPTLGRVHQVAHAGALHRMHVGHAVQGAPDAVGDEHAPALLLPPSLASHAPADCLLLDQLALGDAMHSAPLALTPAVPALAPPTVHAGRSATPHIALFQARGPPRA